jgi:hypothetical protein
MQRLFFPVFLRWLPFCFGLGAVISFAYVAVQQEYRQSLNDPQIQIVTDAQAELAAGDTPAEVVPHEPIFDVASSLTPFVAVLDAQGAPLQSSATVGGQPPHVPLGVINAARATGEDRVTWQPLPHTRIALVVRPVASSTYFVVAGRNMTEIESRENTLTLMYFVALLVSLAGTFILMYGTALWLGV